LQFLRLFAISNHQEVSIWGIWVLSNEFRDFALSWRRNLFVWEERVLENLLEVLKGVFSTQEEDYWKWRPEDNGLFLVDSMYKVLEKLIVWEDSWGDMEKKVWGYFWKGQAPLRVVAFS